MPATTLADRAVLRLSGEDVRGFLQGLVTSDVRLIDAGPVWAGLLGAQGKALFDFLIWASGEDVLIDCEAEQAEALARRLSLYRLRRRIEIGRDEGLAVHWSVSANVEIQDRGPDELRHPRESGDPSPALTAETSPVMDSRFRGNDEEIFADPRLPALGQRWLAPPLEPASGWLAHRLSLGVTEGIAELGSDRTLWLECNAIELNGVAFDKGCYVGQENTARMNWRQKINRRLVVVPIAEASEKRLRVAYPEFGLAVEHRRIEDMAGLDLPDWQRAAIATSSVDFGEGAHRESA